MTERFENQSARNDLARKLRKAGFFVRVYKDHGMFCLEYGRAR